MLKHNRNWLLVLFLQLYGSDSGDESTKYDGWGWNYVW